MNFERMEAGLKEPTKRKWQGIKNVEYPSKVKQLVDYG